MAESTASLKLMIDTNGKRVLFAEAGKDFADVLFNMIFSPLTTVTLLREQGTDCSWANLYASIGNLNESYIHPYLKKDKLLDSLVVVVPTLKKFYMCTKCYASHACSVIYGSDERGVPCLNCRVKMTQNVTYAPESGDEGGFVKRSVTYMVTDDLVVSPMSTVSIFTLLQKLNIKKDDLVEEKVIHLSKDQAMKMLHASLHSKNVLTDVFLGDT